MNELRMSNELTLVPLIQGCLYKFKLEGQAPDLYRFVSWDYTKRSNIEPYVDDESSMVWIAKFKDRKGITVLLDESMVVGSSYANNLVSTLGSKW